MITFDCIYYMQCIHVRQGCGFRRALCVCVTSRYEEESHHSTHLAL